MKDQSTRLTSEQRALLKELRESERQDIRELMAALGKKHDELIEAKLAIQRELEEERELRKEQIAALTQILLDACPRGSLAQHAQTNAAKRALIEGALSVMHRMRVIVRDARDECPHTDVTRSETGSLRCAACLQPLRE